MIQYAPPLLSEEGYFDRFDIAEAHFCFACDYHGGQDSDLYAVECRILDPERIGLNPRGNIGAGGYPYLEENGQAIYRNLQRRHGFEADIPENDPARCGHCGEPIDDHPNGTDSVDGVHVCHDCAAFLMWAPGEGPRPFNPDNGGAE